MGRYKRGLAGDDAQNVGFLQDQQVFAVDLDFRAAPLAEQDAVAGLDVESDGFALVIAGARADSDDFAFLRLFLGGVGDDDATLGLGFGLDATNDDAVVSAVRSLASVRIRSTEPVLATLEDVFLAAADKKAEDAVRGGS